VGNMIRYENIIYMVRHKTITKLNTEVLLQKIIYFMRFYLVTSLENITSSHFGRDGVALCHNSVTCRA